MPKAWLLSVLFSHYNSRLLCTKGVSHLDIWFKVGLIKLKLTERSCQMSFSSNIPAAGRAETISELIKNMIDISFSSEAIFFFRKIAPSKECAHCFCWASCFIDHTNFNGPDLTNKIFFSQGCANVSLGKRRKIPKIVVYVVWTKTKDFEEVIFGSGNMWPNNWLTNY